MALQSQLLRDLERDVQWIVFGDAVKTECDERAAQRCGEPARLAPVQQHERERGIFLRLRHEISGMRIGVENGFGKSGKQRIEDKASKNKPGSLQRTFHPFQIQLDPVRRLADLNL